MTTDLKVSKRAGEKERVGGCNRRTSLMEEIENRTVLLAAGFYTERMRSTNRLTRSD
jgi:hypothetical protein